MEINACARRSQRRMCRMNWLDLNIFLVELFHILNTALRLERLRLLLCLSASSARFCVLVALRLLNDVLGLELLCKLERFERFLFLKRLISWVQELFWSSVRVETNFACLTESGWLDVGKKTFGYKILSFAVVSVPHWHITHSLTSLSRAVTLMLWVTPLLTWSLWCGDDPSLPVAALVIHSLQSNLWMYNINVIYIINKFDFLNIKGINN